MKRAVWLIPLLFSSAVLAACASSGTVPRPQPFPGANGPPASREPVSPADTTPATSTLIATALALRGTPYLNGGSEPTRGFDCSGFVQWVFAQHGTPLPRETRQQYGEGKRVKRDDIQPGDLVFFKTVARGPSHVGIALGAGEFVHAPSSRGVVRVESYESGCWSSRWLGARRMRSGGSSDPPTRAQDTD